jgi:hypothetical protein
MYVDQVLIDLIASSLDICSALTGELYYTTMQMQSYSQRWLESNFLVL